MKNFKILKPLLVLTLILIGYFFRSIHREGHIVPPLLESFLKSQFEKPINGGSRYDIYLVTCKISAHLVKNCAIESQNDESSKNCNDRIINLQHHF